MSPPLAAGMQGLTATIDGIDGVGESSISSSELQFRVARAITGSFTTGGVVSAREACAFVYGYLQVVYIPARLSKNPTARAKLFVLAAQFLGASQAASDTDAATRALQIGASSVAKKLASGLAAVFEMARAPADTARGLAVQVLQHAAALVSAAGEPAAGTGLARAAGLSKENAQGVLAVVSSTASDIAGQAAEVAAKPMEAAQEVARQIEATAEGVASKAEAAVDNAVNLIVGETSKIQAAAGALTRDAAALPAKIEAAAERVTAGALNVAVKAKDEIISAGKEAYRELEAAALKLAEAGDARAKAVLDRMSSLAAQAQEITGKLAGMPAEAKAQAEALLQSIGQRIDSAGAKLAEIVAQVKTSANEAAQKLGAMLEEKLQAALAAAKEVRAAASEIAQGIQATALQLGNRIDNVASKLTTSAQQAMERADATLTRASKLATSIAIGGGVLLLLLLVLVGVR